MTERRLFAPVREIVTKLDSNRSVAVMTDGDCYGLVFTNEGMTTRCLLSKEAMQAVAASHAPLAAGRGEQVKREWKHVIEHMLIDGECGL